MQTNQKELVKMNSCYAVGSIELLGKEHYIAAPDSHGRAVIVDSEKYEVESIWQEPSGTMSFVNIPGRDGEFLTVQNFFPGYDSRHTILAWCKKHHEAGWIIKPIIHIPYIHRFDIFQVGNINYLIVCTLCTNKDTEEDWSSPGEIWGGILPENPDIAPEIEVIFNKLTKNHGYCKVKTKEIDYALVGCQNGILEIYPPDSRVNSWRVEQIACFPVSDVAVCDIDNDGELEYMTIEPFHGDRFIIYKRSGNDFTKIWEYSEGVKFGHVVWGGIILGTPMFIGGYREGNAELFSVFMNPRHPDKFEKLVMDRGKGPANIHVIHGKDKESILVANHKAGELTLYELKC